MKTISPLAWNRIAVVLAALLLPVILSACSPVQHPDSGSTVPSSADVDQFLNTFRSFGGEILTIDATTTTVSAPVSTVGTMAAATVTQGNPPCAGFVEAMPSLVVKLEVPAAALVFEVAASTNATIIVLDEEGQIHCDENAPLTTNPTLSLAEPKAHGYAIFVGRTNMQQPASGTLTVTAQP